MTTIHSSVAPALRQFLEPLRRARGVPRVLLLIGAVLVLGFLILAVFAPLIAPYNFDTYTNADGTRFPKLSPPSAAHLFGTTVRQTDLLSVVVFGARTALEVVGLALLFSVVLGVFVGLASGYIGGWLDRCLVVVTDALFAFPPLLLAIVIAFLASASGGSGVLTAALSITVVYVPQYFRVVRNSVISAKGEPYVLAAVSIGARPVTIVRRYLFTNVVQSVPVIATMNAADAILTLAGLGFLGFGIQPTEAAEWGYELQRSLPDVSTGVWWTSVFPGGAIVLLVAGLTLLGEGLNEIYNPVLARPRVARLRRRAAKKGKE